MKFFIRIIGFKIEEGINYFVINTLCAVDSPFILVIRTIYIPFTRLVKSTTPALDIEESDLL